MAVLGTKMAKTGKQMEDHYHGHESRLKQALFLEDYKLHRLKYTEKYHLNNTNKLNKYHWILFKIKNTEMKKWLLQ